MVGQTWSSRRLGHQKGFTLVEAVMALVMMSLVIVPIMTAAQRLSRDQVTPIQVSRARWLATEKLEEVIADRSSTTRGYSYVITSNYPAENPVATDPDFSRSVTITETGADLQTSGTGYKTVTVVISWTDVTGTSRSLSMSTVVTSFS